MGEYITIGSDSYKLGTCEDLMYVTHAEVEALVPRATKLSGNLEPRDYLKPEYRWFYRFPDPNDSPLWQRDPGPKRRTYVLTLEDDEGIDHNGVWSSFSLNGSYNVNVKVPCPATLRKALKGESFHWSDIPERTPIRPVRERLTESGELYTVFACGWCDAWFSFPGPELESRITDSETKRFLGERLKARRD